MEKIDIFRGNFPNPKVADPTKPYPSNKKMSNIPLIFMNPSFALPFPVFYFPYSNPFSTIFLLLLLTHPTFK